MTELASFGPYSLLSAIAANAVSVSFACRYRPGPVEQLVALKVFRPESTMHPPFIDELVEQSRRVARLNHVNVAPIFDLGSHNDTWYAVTEFVDGIPLLALLAAAGGGQRTLANEVSAFICAEAAAALGYAHGRRDERGQPLGLVHTGLGPHCLILSKSGIVKVTDFGISRAVLLTGLSDRAQPHRLQFTAPEVLRGEETDHRADIFSLGAIAHLMLTGRYIYDGVSGDELRQRAERGYVPRVLDTDSSVPEALAAVIDRALKSNPEDRHDDATSFRGEVGEWLRIHAPGFGRHRLRNYMTRLVPEATYGVLNDRSWSSLHRKDFHPRDANSQIFDDVARWTGETGERDDLRSLLDNPALPDLGGIDLQLLLTGAHPSVRSVADSGIAVAISAGATAVRASSPASPASTAAQEDDSAASLSAEAVRPEPSVAPHAEPEAAPEPQAPIEDEVDFDALAGETYVDDVDEDALAQAARDEVRAARRAQRGSRLPALLAVAVLGGLGYGAWSIWQQASGVSAPAEAADIGVFITSRPQGAEILVDGQPTGLRTPASITDLTADEVSVTLALAGFDAPAAETVRVGATRRLTLELQPAAHTISVTSTPAGAQVQVDGAVVGETPAEVGPTRWDPRDGVRIELTLEGHATVRETVTWEAGETRSEHNFALVSEGSGEGAADEVR